MKFKSLFACIAIAAAAFGAGDVRAMKGTAEAAPSTDTVLTGVVDRIDPARGLLYVNAVEYLFAAQRARVSGSPGGLLQKGMKVTFIVVPEGNRQRITDVTVVNK